MYLDGYPQVPTGWVDLVRTQPTRGLGTHRVGYSIELGTHGYPVRSLIKPKEIRERAGLYHQLQNVPYMPAWRARERLRDTIDGNEGVSFSLIPDWIDRVKKADNSTYIRAQDNTR